VGLSPLSCGVFLPPPLLQAFPLLIAGRCCCFCWPACLFTAHMGSGSSPSLVEFSSLRHSHMLSRSWLLGVPPLLPSLVRPSLFIYRSRRDSPPPPSGLRAPCPLCHVSLLFLLLITHFLFFSPVWELVCPGGYADLAQGCLWEYHVPLSSPCGPHLPKPSGGGLRALLVSLFNVKWRCSAYAGGVEGQKFCLFLVALPARSVSSISPRLRMKNIETTHLYMNIL
jgi:hypothetical protein